MKKSVLLLSLLFSTLSFAGEKFYTLSAKSIKGETVNFSSFKGKTVLFVNIASRCGYTPQLEGLQQLYEKFRSKKLHHCWCPLQRIWWAKSKVIRRW